MGTKSLGAAFKDVARSIIADIIQMTIRMLIFRAISGLFGGGSGGITVTGSSAGAVGKWAKGGVFSGGNVVPFAVGGIVSGPTLFPMSGGRTGLMGEAGPEAVMPLARDSQGRLGVRAGNDNTQRVVVELTLDNELLGARIVEGANAVVEIKRPGIVSQSVNATMRTAGRPTLMGRR
jgi:phage-related minor tail protein